MPWTDILRCCPRCGAPAAADRPSHPFRCAACKLELFANPAVGVGAFASDAEGRVLFVRRAREPGRGLLGLPGGFIDAGETVEEALRRELREEIGAEIGTCTYLCSAPNRYLYAGVTYDVCDLFFSVTLSAGALTPDADEVSAACWLRPSEVDPGMIAFPSVRQAWRRYQEMAAVPPR